MTSFHIRPRFQQKVNISIEDFKKLVKDNLSSTSTCMANFSKNMVILKIPIMERHYWSPQLSLTLEKHPEFTLIRGLYGPNPTIWTMFAFGYGMLAIFGIFHLIIGLSLWQMGKGLFPLLSIVIELCLATSLYIAAQFGQKKGAEQLYRLHFFVENLLHYKIKID